MEQIAVKDLSFTYPLSSQKSLSHIDLSVRQGEYIVLCGKSGCGKTTLLKHLKSVLTPKGTENGCVYYNGTKLADIDLRTQASEIGFVMQSPDNQIVTDKVWHELAFGLENLGFSDSEIRLRVAEMASYFGIQDWFDKRVDELSGGQKQLLNLASVMAMHPSVLVLDEPTSQLDPVAAANFLSTIEKINRELGTTVLITEHRLEEIFPYADRAVVMERGEIMAEGKPGEVGMKLKDSGMSADFSLPSAMRIYMQVDSRLPCPLTVRQGKEWLSELFKDREAAFTCPEFKEKVYEKNWAVEAKHVFFRYDRNQRDVLKDFSIAVPKGTVYSILGGNGTGKSTALKVLCGLYQPYRGKVSIQSKPIDRYKGNELYRKHVGYLPQQVQTLFVQKTVRLELEEMLDKRCSNKAQRMKETAELMQLDEALLDRHPYDLSGGEQQRAALAKVLLTDPEILLLDEPTKGMDSGFKHVFADFIKAFTNQGKTVIMVSHDIEFCASNSDICAMFFDGHIVSSAGAHKFFSENTFYTTASNRMSRHIFSGAITDEDVVALCKKNLKTSV